ncbi:MAG: translation initiation factor IF-2 subunit beta [Desulfurococcales archaeon ex4484_58]|nr:MAG: translation initiation factor IF-2 subunit beta [Desulfurococcales archaeon ex4484_58]
MAKKVREYSYEELLDRAYSRLPAKKGPAPSFTIPRAEVMFVGGRTLLLNFKEITEILNREPSILQKFLVKELGAPAFLNESGQLVLQGRFNVHILNKLIQIFTEKYVICPTCGSKDTKLIKKGKVFILRCEACGAETTLEAF